MQALRCLCALVATAILASPPITAQNFRSGVDLVDVTVTVTDERGRFVSGLAMEDFTVYEDGAAQEITFFANERVPMSLGLALDTSGSMTPDKMAASRSAIDRFVHDLLGDEDELFYLQFANRTDLVQDWTSDRDAISRAVGHAFSAGGTALYDAISEAVPLAQSGSRRKKALLVISDGNDTGSDLSPNELRQRIRNSDVLVYALGIDGTSRPPRRRPRVQLPLPIPFPVPGRWPQPRMPPVPPTTGGGIWTGSNDNRVDADALRQITDDTGGRTEILRGFGELDAATARIADELSKQYYLGYVSSGERDGLWHSITVEVEGRRLNVRARRGFVAPSS